MNQHSIPQQPETVPRKQYQRELAARRLAEDMLSLTSKELWDLTKKLVKQTEKLDAQVAKRTEKLERMASQAEAANKSKSQFLASMSHEIRTPLNGVLGMAQALSDTDLTADQRAMTSTILESGELLLSVLNDILDISKIEAGQMEVEQVAMDVEQVIEATHKLFEPKAAEKDIDLRVEIKPSAKRWVKSDPTRLRQAIGNLISNAIKFTGQGSVTVSVTLIDAMPSESILCISVQDTGIGIAPDKMSRLFQPFSQADVSTARRFGGSGLGLTISRQICQMLGGDLVVDSTPGQGSIFTATARVTPAEARKSAQDDLDYDVAIEQIAQTGARVLLAEDNRTNQLVFKKFIKGLDLDLVVVETGAQAVAAAREQRFDVIFMDINMPQMDGVTATSHIRAAEARQEQSPTPIIALTANAMVDQISTYLAAGMDKHLPKPLKKNSLIVEIALAAAKGSKSSP